MEAAMEHCVAVKISDSIISPLGFTSADNYKAVKAGMSALRLHESCGLQEPFMASLMDWNKVIDECGPNAGNNYTRFERMLILSVVRAASETAIDLSSPRVIFIISTTKGNVELLDEDKCANMSYSRIFLSEAAKQVTYYFKNPNKAIVVSNACISGLCAQIMAMRMLQSGDYDYAVTVGCDVQSPFIISGFQSFKALSQSQCKPFDKNRDGLNLGEAAATIIYGRKSVASVEKEDWVISRGAIRNDANHISGPSRTGEGSFRALQSVIEDVDDLAFVNVHGTATLYNDEMESIALGRAGLRLVPVTGFKGYYGHTMGAAGVLETIISMWAIDDNTVLATRGFETPGVSVPLKVSKHNQYTGKRSFIKLLSGFGGCNAAVLFKKGGSL